MRTRTTIVLAVLALAVVIALGTAALGLGGPLTPTDQSKVPHYFGPYSNYANSSFTAPTATVTINGDGTGAKATATVGALGGLTGVITGITITDPGSGYTAATVSITGPGTGASADASVTSSGAVTAIAVNTPGGGFTKPTVAIDPPAAGMTAAATAFGQVDVLTLGNAGSGYHMPTVNFDLPDDPNGTQATGHLVCVEANCAAVAPATTVTITGIALDSPGSGYSSAPGVAILDGTQFDPVRPGGTGATASATLQVMTVAVDVPGSGYTAIPNVVITDPTGIGSGATATAVTSIGTVTDITNLVGGSGYVSAGGIRKFVDALPGLCNPAETNPAAAVKPCPATPGAKYIPLGVPDTTSYASPASDSYEIGLVQYRTKFSSDVPATLVRGYVQIETPANAAVSQHFLLVNEMLDGTTVPVLDSSGNQVYSVTPPQYLGPTIAATKDKPVRIVFHNYLPTGEGGDLFLPVDTTIMGSGQGPGVMPDPEDNNSVMDTVRNPLCGENDPVTGLKPVGCYAENRATLHLHGGVTPWISDGTPHQWITPANQTGDYPKGVSVTNVPDMPDPGAGAQTFFYTNQQSARLMFYHDHSWGITRLNVYAGEAAGYLITDPTEQKLITSGTIPGAADTIPLIIQDKTFVPNAAQLASQDPTWDISRWGGEGNMWTPHVYMPAQNPSDPTGMNPFGRWMYGPWFWPPSNGAYGPIDNPYYQPDPALPNYSATEPPLIPGTPNITVGMEAFNDTPIVNGMAYPKVTLDPKTYRLRILNAANDRFWNLQWYVADPTTGTLSEVALKPAELAAAQTDPNVVPTPDRTLSPAGPTWLQIGTEGGFLPAPAVIPNQPITWITDPTRFDFGNVDKHALLLAPAERADTIVDFSQYAGQTLILYNDAPAAFPARVAGYDYYTGGPDLSPMGAPTTLPGYGPNTRTIMQVTIAGNAPAPAFNQNTLNAAFRHKADGSGVFESGQHPIIVGQASYNSAYGTGFVASGWCNAPGATGARSKNCDGYARIQEGKDPTDKFGFNGLRGAYAPGVGKLQIPFQPKGMHDEMNAAAFDDYGRMEANLGLEAPGATPLLQNIILYPYVNPQTELIDATNLPKGDVDVEAISSSTDGTQIWKITHNGVDTHPIHFHLYDVQIINRVTWDNIIIPPDANELGWKETIRVSPLEDTYIALRPIIPTLPFKLPNSIRRLNPALPADATMGFNNVDAKGNPTGPILNTLVNFGYEYVYHCHILSHEEKDMMRPVSVAVPPETPDGLLAPIISPDATTLNLSWNDNSLDETAFVIQRDTGSGFHDLATLGIDGSNPAAPIDTPNTVGLRSYTDTTFNAAAVPAYSYRVVAQNTIGYGGAYMDMTVQSTSLAVVAGGVGPAAPINLTGIVSAGGAGPNGLQVALSWTNNASNATGFVVQRSLAGANTFTQIGTVNAPGAVLGSTGNFTDITVAPGISYDYRVAATNAAGMSAYSNVWTAVVPPAPNAPSGLTATAQFGPQIALAWTDNSTNETGFTIQRATDTAFTTGLTSYTVAANVTAYTDTTGVVPGTTYSYRVRADNTFVASAWSNTATVTFPAVPAVPAALTATQLPGLQASLTWTVNPASVTGFSLQRATDAAFTTGLVTVPLGASPTSYTDSGLVPGTTYYYRVAALNPISGPSAYSNTATLAVLAVPSAPTTPVGTQQAGLQVLVAWTNTTAGGVATDITLQRSVNGGATWASLGVLAPTTALYLDAPVVPGTTYLYRVNASNISGVSAWATSSPVVVPSIPAAPSGLANTITRTAAGPDTVVLVWVDNSTNETGFTLQRATDAAFTTGLVEYPLGANTTTFTNTVVHGTDYFYRILAFNLSGSSAWSNTLNVLTVPLTPTNFRTNGRSRTTISLAWADVSTNETGYQLQRRRVGAGNWTTVLTTAANVTSYTDTGRNPNTRFDYRVRGVNGVGNSPWAPTVRVATLP
jgi:FtsP/CotA-like multicopper oxidase with cupredoxin domain